MNDFTVLLDLFRDGGAVLVAIYVVYNVKKACDENTAAIIAVKESIIAVKESIEALTDRVTRLEDYCFRRRDDD